MKETKDSFIVYRSFHVAISALSDEDRLLLYDAIFEYGLNHKEIDLEKLPKAMFTLIKPQLQANYRKWQNGLMGGRPTKNQSESNEEPNENHNESKQERNANANANVKENAKENVISDENITGLPLKDGNVWFFDDEFIKECKIAYPSVQVEVEANKMRGWLIGNPTKRKTARGIRRFVTGWLATQQSRNEKSVDDQSYQDIGATVRANLKKNKGLDVVK